MPRLSLIVSLACLLTVSAFAQVVPGPGSSAGPTSVIVGQIQTATGGAINRGTLTFTLSQPAVVSGSASIATQQTACYTSAAGNIVGLPDPLPLPVTSTNTASGTLPAGTYYVEIYYIGAGGFSAESPEAVVNLPSQGTVNVNAPSLQPSSAVGFYGVAIGTSSGAETVQGTLASWTQYQQSTALVSGSNPPSVNTSSCSLYFSDQLIPTGTYYTVNLLNKNGSKVAGFPQTWCTYGGAGATINVSNGAPAGNCSTNGVFYPTPIFSNPPNTVTQNISTGFGVAGNLNVGGSSSFLGPQISTNAGLFTNTQMNLYISSLLNGCNPTTLFQLTHSSVFSTDGFTSCVLVPSSSTVTQINGISAMVQNNANSSTGSVNNAVGGSFVGYAGASGAWVWGINPLVSDAAGLTSTGLLNEYDLNIFGTPGYVSLFRVNGFVTGTMPAGIAPGSSANAGSALMDVVHGVSTNPVWPVGLNFQDGSISNIVLQVGALCTSGSCASPKIAFTSYGGGHALQVGSINADAAGSFIFTPALGSGALTLPPKLFSAYPACSVGTEGSWATITNSTTATPGATITGGGAHHVLGYCNSVNWLVVVGT